MSSPDSRGYWGARMSVLMAPTALPVLSPATTLGEPVHRRIDVASDATDAQLEAAWALLLSRYVDDEHVVFGVDGRPRPVHVDDDAHLPDWLATLEAARESDHGHPIDVTELRRVTNWPKGEPLYESSIGLDPEAPLSVIREDGRVVLSHDATRLAPAPAERLARHLARILEGLGNDGRVGDVAMLTDEEREWLTTTLNATEHPFPTDACLHQQFEAWAREQPEAVAIVFRDREVTYRELDERANRLAHHLVETGAGTDTPVAVFLPRGIELVVAIVAVLKAGSPYAPLDPTYPAERLTFMLADTRAPVIITTAALAERLPPQKADVVVVDRDAELVAGRPSSAPEVAHDPESLAYIIYTSGSTGTPKGIAIRHRGALNNIHDLNTRYGVGPDDCLMVMSSLSFDMCVYEILGTLMAGAKMIVTDPERGADPAHWAELTDSHQVTVWNSAPQLLELFVSHVEGMATSPSRRLRLTILGGDWVPVSLPERFKAISAEGARVIVLGGATEASIHSTVFEVTQTDPAWKSIPYGRPMYNQSCYVLDRKRRLCPVGVPGELHLGGVGLARGYLHRPELTAEKFIDNPHGEGRLYRTGDKVVMGEDGLLHLLGRIDFMVKIRGQRIELGEVEAALLTHENVHQTVAMVRQDAAGDQVLTAYVVTGGAEELATTGVDRDEQVAEWQQVYDAHYDRTDAADPTFDLTGWTSSYTGQPIAADQMRVWVDTTVDRIRALEPRRVLEIGCGTGLLLFRLVTSCDHYLGVDFSPVVIANLRRHVTERGLRNVQLHRRVAHDFSGIEEGTFDTVVLNSIILQFPDRNYVETVLRGAVRALRPGGALFVGDVRHLPTLWTYHASVQLHRADANAPLSVVRQRTRQEVDQEEELLMAPSFFHGLGLEGVEDVEVSLKRGAFENELTKYRYDVTLRTAARPRAVPTETITGPALDLEQLSAMLSTKPDCVLLVGIEDQRLSRDRAAAAAIAEGDGDATAGELRQRLVSSHGGTDPERVFSLGEAASYRVSVRHADDGADGCFDALLVRADLPAMRFPADPPQDRSTARINDPLARRRARALVPELREHVGNRLPSYMVPNAFVILDQLPLTPNGKVDRRALPAPTRSGTDRGARVAPRDDLEKTVADVWATILNVADVGIDDHFIEMGGHSLSATRIVARLCDIFPVELKLADLFGNLTVQLLAGRLRELGAAASVDVDGVARLFLEVEGLSDEEVEALLAEQEAP